MGTTPRAAEPYRRRREAGAASREQTRRRLLRAADELFREQGYAATTVTAIAGRADVSLQTLYLAWGSKRAIFRAAAAAAASDADVPAAPEEWRTSIRSQLAQQAGEHPSAQAYLAAVARLFVRVTERTIVYTRMHRQAAATDPEIAAEWDAVIAARRRTMADVAATMPRTGLRPDLDEDDVTDTLWAIASPDTYDLLTVHGQYTPAAVEAWLERALTTALCTDATPPPIRRAARSTDAVRR